MMKHQIGHEKANDFIVWVMVEMEKVYEMKKSELGGLKLCGMTTVSLDACFCLFLDLCLIPFTD